MYLCVADMPPDVAAIYMDILNWDAEKRQQEIADAEVNAVANAAASEVAAKLRI